MEPPKERISKNKGWQMIGTAGLFDLIGIIPLVNIAVAIARIMLFPLWFNSLGVPYSKKNKMWWWEIITFIIGLIPVVADVLPELTLGVVRNVIFAQREDRKAIAEYNAAQKQKDQNTAQGNYPQPLAKIGPAQSRRVDGIRKAA